jgi:carboxyl-terminal processing protease
MRHYRAGWVALILILAVGGSAWLFQAAYYRLHPAAPGPQGHVAQLLEALEGEYVKPLTPLALLKGGVKGMRTALEDEKVSLKDLPALVGTRREELLKSFDGIFEECLLRSQGKLSREELTYAALRGMIESLDDPYCDVMTPKENAEFESEMAGGNFGGIGIYIEADPRHNNRLTVTEPIEGSPAEKAGFRPGDLIVKIGDRSTKSMSVEDAANLIRGPKGTEVVVTVQRPGGKPQTHRLKRATIHVSSVNSKMLAKDIGYLRLRMFGDETDQEFAQELDELREKGAKALILDLRNNGGGYVTAAESVCSHFLDKGQLIVSVVNSRTSRNESYTSNGRDLEPLPMVVLINRFSASASEITAGCLQDHQLATLMGETSYGKASVQKLLELEDGGAVKFTVAHYLTPEGRDIHHKGIAPDIKLEDSDIAPGEDDPMLRAATRQLEKRLVKL